MKYIKLVAVDVSLVRTLGGEAKVFSLNLAEGAELSLEIGRAHV